MGLSADVEAIKADGNAAFKKGDYATAKEMYSQALSMCPPETEGRHLILSNRAAALLGQQDYGEAAKDAEECVKAKPDWMKGWSRLGEARRGLGDAIGSAVAFSKAVEIQPNNVLIRQQEEKALDHVIAHADEVFGEASKLFQTFHRSMDGDERKVSFLTELFTELRATCHDYKEKLDDRSLDDGTMMTLRERGLRKLFGTISIIYELKDLQQTEVASTVKMTLMSWIQAMLDVTFVDENQLVEGDFADNAKLKSLLTKLKRPFSLVDGWLLCDSQLGGNTTGAEESEDTKMAGRVGFIGIELVECICWRNGALRYMFASDRASPSLADQDKKALLHIMDEGAEYLKCVTSVRKQTKNSVDDFDGQVVEGGQGGAQTHDLLSRGIYSDTHLLSLVYYGELEVLRSHLMIDEERMREGIVVLKEFIDIVEGPMKGHGWESSAANNLIDQLQKKLGA